MPNYFKFINKETGEAERFIDIDEKICEYMEVEPDPEWFYEGWYDSIGLAAAMGNDWPKIRETFEDTRLLPIIDFLSQRYDISSWAMR